MGFGPSPYMEGPFADMEVRSKRARDENETPDEDRIIEMQEGDDVSSLVTASPIKLQELLALSDLCEPDHEILNDYHDEVTFCTESGEPLDPTLIAQACQDELDRFEK
jgi:hypothetical protein